MLFATACPAYLSGSKFGAWRVCEHGQSRVCTCLHENGHGISLTDEKHCCSASYHVSPVHSRLTMRNVPFLQGLLLLPVARPPLLHAASTVDKIGLGSM